VVRATPIPGTRLTRGTLIDLEISSGPASVPKPVPNLVGLAIEQVEDTLRKYEMRLGTIDRRQDDGRPVGTVLAQSPTAGERLLPLSPVNLICNLPPAESPADTLPREDAQ
jgi:serine/threonine-protein kinase